MLINFNNIYYAPEKFKLLINVQNNYILHNINLKLQQQFIAIIGPSGGGKTTLAKMIAGDVTPSAGKLDILPENRKIGIVYQNSFYILNPYRTVEAQLLEVKAVTATKESFDERYKVLRNKFGFEEKFLHKKAGELSGGERQRVAIGRQLLFLPDLLILDEPFSAQDNSYKTDISVFLRNYCEQFNVHLICISHEIEYLEKLCERFIVIDSGKIIDDGTLEELTKNSVNEITLRLLSAQKI